MINSKAVLSCARNELIKLIDNYLKQGILLCIFKPPNLVEMVIDDVLDDYRKNGWEVETRPFGKKLVIEFGFPKPGMLEKEVARTKEVAKEVARTEFLPFNCLKKAGDLEDECRSVSCGGLAVDLLLYPDQPVVKLQTRSHPRPVITSDIIVFENGKVLLIERAKDPFKGHYALPGGHFDVDKDETIKDSAIRELEEETGIRLPLSCLNFVGYFDKKERDPRGRYVGFCWCCEINFETAFKAKAGDDAKNLTWFPISSLPTLAFDHEEMIKTWKVIKDDSLKL